jgi:hypothetical protein
LASLPKLSALELYMVRATALPPLPELRWLSLRCSQVDQLGQLSASTEMEILDLAFSDVDVNQLLGLSGLERLDLRGVALDDSEAWSDVATVVRLGWNPPLERVESGSTRRVREQTPSYDPFGKPSALVEPRRYFVPDDRTYEGSPTRVPSVLEATVAAADSARESTSPDPELRLGWATLMQMQGELEAAEHPGRVFVDVMIDVGQ